MIVFTQWAMSIVFLVRIGRKLKAKQETQNEKARILEGTEGVAIPMHRESLNLRPSGL